MDKYTFRKVAALIWPSMRFTICLLTNLLFVVHCLMGCCVHHVHAHGGDCGQAVYHAENHCSHDHHATVPVEPANDHECPNGPCHEGCCIYVKSEFSSVDRGVELVNSFATSAAVLDQPALEQGSPTVTVAPIPPPNRQLYLVLCALLI